MKGTRGHSGRVGLAIRMTRQGRSAAGGADPWALEVTVNACEVHQEREGARGVGVARLKELSQLQVAVVKKVDNSNSRF